MIDIEKLKDGDILHEMPHYVVIQDENTPKDAFAFFNLESEEVVSISADYVKMCLHSADHFDRAVKIGKEDKYWTEKQVKDWKTEHSNLTVEQLFALEIPRVGDLKLKGIRTIFQEIPLGAVFTVVFRKADTPLTQKKYKELLQKQIDEAVTIIEETAKSKKGVAIKAAEVLKNVQENPILPYEPGELRTLRGFKLENYSRDGKYDCYDMDMPDTKSPKTVGKPSNIRQVNINTIVQIVYNNTQYNLE